MLKKAVLFAISLSVVGCGSKKKAAESTGGEAPKGGAAAEAPKGPLKLEKVGNLQLDLAGVMSVDDAPGGGAMIMGENPLVVKEAGQFDSKTLDEAKKEAEMYSPKDVKGEALPDGYWLTFVNSGSMGDNFWVQVRREIGGKAYACSTTASKLSQQEAALAACKSLRP